MLSPLLERCQLFLRRAGYGVVFRSAEWSECLVHQGEERWLGRGVDDGDAFDDALRQMLPSRLARELFQAQLANATDEPASAVLSAASEGAPPLEATALDGREGTAAPEEGPLPEPIEAPPLIEAPTFEAITELPAPQEPLAETAEIAAPAAALGAQVQVEPDSKAVSLADTLLALERMLRDIDEQLPTLARKSAERQRIYLLAWICRARAFEEALPDARQVVLAVQRIARRLSEIGKMLWPGSVRALQIATTPADTMEPYAADAPPSTWAEAADRAESRRSEHIFKATSAGFDEDGWIDANAGRLAPPNPDALLAQTVADLDALLARAGEALPEGQDLAALVRIAQTLRWVRQSVQDHLAWGLAMGRLRRLSLSLGLPGATLRRTIDPTFRPSSSWIPADTVQPDSAPKKDISAELVAELTELDPDGTTLFPWLLRAFDVFPTPTLAEMLRPWRKQTAALGEIAATYEDRRIRRRMRDLLQRLESGGVEDVPRSAQRDTPPPEDEEAESTDDSALQQLCDRVRPHTEGRRVLFASNRQDDRLEARLTALLGVRMTGCDGAPRRVQSQCERIAQGSYDLVLSATGFQDHAIDGAMARAASAAGIPYVRVNRGRPLACAQAIARELGDGSSRSLRTA
ncbi:MAG: hypothetical protein ABI134_21345 [Byssovorax sp.]